jgi:NAD(P)H dehydrogenase (quinone)
MTNMEEIRGGSSWGSGTLAGPAGDRPVSKIETEIATHHGEFFAKFLRDLHNGRTLQAKM